MYVRLFVAYAQLKPQTKLDKTFRMGAGDGFEPDKSGIPPPGDNMGAFCGSQSSFSATVWLSLDRLGWNLAC